MAEIVEDSGRRQANPADLRHLRTQLSSSFTPAGYAEFAGTYRGMPGTPLADERIGAGSAIEPEPSRIEKMEDWRLGYLTGWMWQ